MTSLSHYLRPPLRRPWWVYGSAVLLMGVSAWAGYYAHVTDVANDATLALINAEQAKRARAVPAKPTRAQIEEQKQWEQLARERDFNWGGIFQALQNANHPGIELLEFRPEKRQGVIILRGEAQSTTALSEYLQKIRAQPAFAQIYLTKQDLRAHGQLETVGFEIRGSLIKH